MPSEAVPERWSVIEWAVADWAGRNEFSMDGVLHGWPHPRDERACNTWVRVSFEEAVEWASQRAQQYPGKYFVVVKIHGFAHVSDGNNENNASPY